MPNLTNGAESMLGEITLTKQTGTVLTLYTNDTYVDEDIEFSIGAQSAVAAGNTAAADADVESTDDGNVGGVNISDSIGTKQTTEPTSGYYIRVKATGSGSSKVTSPGWLDAGDLAPASTTSTKFFPIDEASATVAGTNVVTPSASISGSHVTMSNVDNGIAVTATGGGTASATATATTDSAGYAPGNTTLDSATINAQSQTTTATTYISGVTLEAPASGTRSFSITVPNGNSTVTFTFNVDASGNVHIS